MAIQGFRVTTDASEFRERPENWRQGILLLEPNGSAPLYALTSLMSGGGSTDDSRFHWFEEELPDYRVVVDGSIDGTTQDIPLVEGGEYFKEGDLLFVEQTTEVMMVLSNPTTDTAINVQRGFAGSTAAALDTATAGINPHILLMGSAYEEGSAPPEGRTYAPIEHDNYCQIFRDNIEVTNTARKTRLRTGEAVKEDKRRCLTRHSIGVEKAMWLGRKSLTMKNGRPRRTMDGILPQIPSMNTFSPATGGGMSLTMLEGYLKQIFRYGSNEKMGFCGNSFMLGLNQAVRLNSSYDIQMGVKEYGMNVSRVLTPFGTLVLKTHPLFNQITGGEVGGTAYTGMDSWCFVMDMANLKYRYLEGRDTKYMPNQEQPGVDGMNAGYLTECSIQLSQRKTHGLIKGVTAGIQDS